MILPEDLRAAVGSGLLNETQAASLAALADSRRGARENLAADDEPFELFKGFNEIFVVIGLLILSAGWMASVSEFVMAMHMLPYKARDALAMGSTGALIWLLSEYFIRRRRMVAPAIALSCLWAAVAVKGFLDYFAIPLIVAQVQQDFSSFLLPIGLSTGATLIYWLRFRVPFTMALISLGVFSFALLLGAIQSGSPSGIKDLFLLSAGGPFAFITLGVGLLGFFVAMYFDMSDPHRVTRRSAQGFWLHIVAAPALVNTVALTMLAAGTGSAQIVLFAYLVGFAVVAIVIDRRSLLISGIGYIVVLAITVFGGGVAALVILLLGISLVVLGAFWVRIRAALLAPLSGFLPLNRLPPSH